MKIKRRIELIYWWLMHRLHPKHRYHILNTGLPPGYYSPCEQIPHAVFNTVCKFYEQGSPMFDWDVSGKSDEFYAMSRIYNYWKIVRPQLEKDYEKSGKVALYREIEKEDKKYLHMIIDILPHLWYA